VAGADVPGVTAQIDAFLAAGGSFRDDDLVTVLAGANDIRALHQAVLAGTLGADVARQQAEAAGVALAAQVNRMAALGAKVLVSTVPNQGLTPAGRVDAAQSEALRRLTLDFNTGMRTTLTNDGRQIGLVLMDEAVENIADAEGFNDSDPACNDATVDDVLTCTSLTLREGASTATWLWADRQNLSPLGQATLGSLAVNRAVNNPF
jgi:phospholipase/lecithinase/hemolysin